MNTLAQTDNPEITFPLFHMNGNSPEVLGKEYFEAAKAFNHFTEKFFDIEFHSRDYYPMGPEAFENALAKRYEIKSYFSRIRNYLDAHASHCFESTRKS